MFRFAHAYRFATDALHAGFDREDIADAYRYALRVIDDDLAHLPREIRWEPSSLVRLARFRLGDSQSNAERVRNRAAALRNAKRRATPAAFAMQDILAPAPAAPTETESASFFGEIAALMAQTVAA